MNSVQTRIADVFLAHTPSGAEGASLVSCWCDKRFDTFAHHAEHVAAEVVAALGLRELGELLRYFVDSPKGWVGEGREVAEDALAVLRGEPVSEWWRQRIAEARAAGWERTE